jgi:tetratricopeptide (TPR) repeat protein
VLLRRVLLARAQQAKTSPRDRINLLREATQLVDDAQRLAIEHALARALIAAGELDRAEEWLRTAHPASADHRAVLNMDLAGLELERGEAHLARERLRALLPDLRARNSVELVPALINSSVACLRDGDPAEAETLLREAYACIEHGEGNAPWHYQAVHEKLVAIFVARHRFDDAIVWQARLVKFLTEHVPGAGRRSRRELVELFAARGDLVRAREEARAGLAAFRNASDVHSSDYIALLVTLARLELADDPPGAWAHLCLAQALCHPTAEGSREISALLASIPGVPNPASGDVAAMMNIGGERLGHLVALSESLLMVGKTSPAEALVRELVSHSLHDPDERRTRVRLHLKLAADAERQGTAAAARGEPGAAYFEAAAAYVEVAMIALTQAGGAQVLENRPGGPDRYTEAALVLRARIATAFGKPEQAFVLHEQARGLRQQWDANASSFQGTATDDVLAAVALGRWADAEAALTAWLTHDDRHLTDFLGNQDQESVSYMDQLLPIYTAAITAAAHPDAPPSLRRLVMDMILRRKAIVSDAVRMRRLHAQGRFELFEGVTSNDVAAALHPHTLLIEYVLAVPIRHHASMAAGESRFGPPRYTAFILSSEPSAEVEVVDLGDRSEISHRIAEWLRFMNRRGRDVSTLSVADEIWPVDDPRSSRNAGIEVRRVLLDPILTRFGERHLIIAPDELIATVPFHALPREEGEVLTEGPPISYVTSGRDLVRRHGKVRSSSPVVIADPDYGFNLGAPSSIDSSLASFASLPGVKAEGEHVARTLGVRLVSGGDASREHLLAVRSPSILHIATHGFAIHDPEAPPHSLAALRRSGLALAGANLGPAGILTAEDAAQLDLDGTELVVLSACETGLGQLTAGEGVLGLRRSFLVAGTRALVISLWRVPDAQTRDLMFAFYEQIVAGHSVGDSLLAAQRALALTANDPAAWAGFVCIGDSGCRPWTVSPRQSALA